MTHPNDLARQLLTVEQRLEAYQRLHRDELAELRRMLDGCKSELATLLSNSEITVAQEEHIASALPGRQPVEANAQHAANTPSVVSGQSREGAAAVVADSPPNEEGVRES